MSDPADEEVAELRELQRRAYAPGGTLNEAERERLHELQNRGRSAAAGAAEDGSAASAPREGIRSGEGTQEPEAAHVQANPDALASEDHEEDAPRRRPRGILLGAAFLGVGIVLGLLIPLIAEDGGWMLTAEQRERRAAIAEDEAFDAGSLTLVSEGEEVRVWAATRGEGLRTCVVLDHGGVHSTECTVTERFAETSGFGLLSTVLESPSGGELIQASLMRALGGELVAIVYRHSFQDVEPDWISRFPEDAQPFAEQLVEEGFDLSSLELVGRFEGAPLWSASRTAPSMRCLVLSGQKAQSHCEPGSQIRESGLQLVVTTGTQAAPEGHELTLNYDNWGQSYLAIRTIDPGKRFPGLE